MKAYKYKLLYYRDSTTYYAIYIPGRAVMGFKDRSDESFITFFRDDENSFRIPERVIREGLDENGGKVHDVREFELPDRVIEKFITEGKKFNQARNRLIKTTKDLVSLIKTKI